MVKAEERDEKGDEGQDAVEDAKEISDWFFDEGEGGEGGLGNKPSGKEGALSTIEVQQKREMILSGSSMVLRSEKAAFRMVASSTVSCGC